MDLESLVRILDASLVRELFHLKTGDGNTVSFVNEKGLNLSATVDGVVYSDLIKVCLVNGEVDVSVYLNYLLDGKFVKLSLGDIISFSIS